MLNSRGTDRNNKRGLFTEESKGKLYCDVRLDKLLKEFWGTFQKEASEDKRREREKADQAAAKGGKRGKLKHMKTGRRNSSRNKRSQ